MTEPTKLWHGVDLVSEINAGSTIQEIADMAGKPYDNARLALMRRGLKPNFPYRVGLCRSAIDDMKPIDAVEYLAAILEEILPIFSSKRHLIDDIEASFTKSERVILGVLIDASPSIVTADQLYSALYALRADTELPCDKIITVLVCKIRKKLPVRDGSIITHWGRGFSFAPGDQA